MNNLLTRTYFFLLFTLSISSQCLAQNDDLMIDESFEVALEVEQVSADLYNLFADVKLSDGSYIYSPKSTDSFYLPFTFDIEPNDFIEIVNPILERPKSAPEIDPYINKPVNYVRTNTRYILFTKVLTTDDFEYSGVIEYLLEPKCIPYDVPFVISYKDGELTIEKGETLVSAEYKR